MLEKADEVILFVGSLNILNKLLIFNQVSFYCCCFFGLFIIELIVHKKQTTTITFKLVKCISVVEFLELLCAQLNSIRHYYNRQPVPTLLRIFKRGGGGKYKHTHTHQFQEMHFHDHKMLNDKVGLFLYPRFFVEKSYSTNLVTLAIGFE